MELNTNKAGMEGLDKAAIEGVIRTASAGSRFERHRAEKAAKLQLRVEEEKKTLGAFSAHARAEALEKADLVLAELRGGRALEQTVVHVDMDAFFAAVEMRDSPELRDVPMAVGGSAMLSTSNYAARRFGVRAAMPGFIARKLCPQLRIVAPHFDKYRAASDAVRIVLTDYDPDYAMASMDEAYLNITRHVESRTDTKCPRRRFGGSCQCRLPRLELDSDCTAAAIEESCLRCGRLSLVVDDEVAFGGDADGAVAELRHRVHQATGLTCSAGIAPSGMLAKICSDQRKPNGQFRLAPDASAIDSFLRLLPIRKVSGIGGVSEALLRGAHGVEFVGDLISQRAGLLLTSSFPSFRHLMATALGIGATFFTRLHQSHHISLLYASHLSERERKSLSVERTFGALSGWHEQVAMLESLCDSLVEELNKEDLKGRTLTLKYKTVAFEVRTRATTLPRALRDKARIFPAARDLLTAARSDEGGDLSLRLMGVRLSSFERESMAAGGGIAAFLRSEEDHPECPVCGRRIQTETEEGIDAHVEECLSQAEIRNILQSEGSTQRSIKRVASPEKKPPVSKMLRTSRSITDFFPAKSME